MIAKKEKRVYWFIGFGCGIILAGLIMTYMGLAIQGTIEEDFKAVQQEIRQLEASQRRREQTENNKLQTSSETEYPLDQEGALRQEIIQVEISDDASSTEICTILEESGVVQSASALHTFIKNQQKSTRLRTGNFEFSLPVTHEEVLSILLREKK